jgi:hypothetical protein
MNLQPHQQRVVDEQRELAVLIDELTASNTSDAFKVLPEAERSRRARQLYHMEQYDRALLERIVAFDGEVCGG